MTKESTYHVGKGLPPISAGRAVHHSDTQVIHDPRQVKSPEELVEGKVYEEFTLGGPHPWHLKVVRTIIPGEPGFFEVEYVNIEGPLAGTLGSRSLADNGIIPYKNGGWQAHVNYLLPVEEEPRQA